MGQQRALPPLGVYQRGYATACLPSFTPSGFAPLETVVYYLALKGKATCTLPLCFASLCPPFSPKGGTNSEPEGQRFRPLGEPKGVKSIVAPSFTPGGGTAKRRQRFRFAPDGATKGEQKGVKPFVAPSFTLRPRSLPPPGVNEGPKQRKGWGTAKRTGGGQLPFPLPFVSFAVSFKTTEDPLCTQRGGYYHEEELMVSEQ